MAGCRSVRAETAAADGGGREKKKKKTLIKKIITCDFNLLSKQRPNATDKQRLVCQLLLTPAQTHSEFVRFGRCSKIVEKWKPQWSTRRGLHQMFRPEAFTTTRLRTPQGFTHHCTDVHTTPPKDWGHKAGKQPLFTNHDSISASWTLPETSGFSRIQTGAVITTYHGNYAFRAAASVFSQRCRTVPPLLAGGCCCQASLQTRPGAGLTLARTPPLLLGLFYVQTNSSLDARDGRCFTW